MSKESTEGKIFLSIAFSLAFILLLLFLGKMNTHERKHVHNFVDCRSSLHRRIVKNIDEETLLTSIFVYGVY